MTIRPQLEISLDQRLCSIDAFRGLVMVLLISGTYSQFRDGFGIASLAGVYPDSGILHTLSVQLSHSVWEGCTLWDLIMPAFIFISGLVIPFSNARRLRRGDRRVDIAKHGMLRACLFVVLGGVGFIIIGNLVLGRWPKHIDPDFSNVLPQIGLSYCFALLVVGRGLVVQLATAIGILIGDWMAFVAYPIQSGILEQSTSGFTQGTTWLSGIFAHWSRDANLAADFDRWFLNLLPRTDPYIANSTGVQTLNFIPTISTMIFGVIVGELLTMTVPMEVKLRRMLLGGFLAIGVGLFLGKTICPIVKPLWSPAWTIFSAGCVVVAFATIYWIVDGEGLKAWTFPFVIVGVNSIAAYCVANIFDVWIASAWRLILGKDVFTGPLGGVWLSMAAILSIWTFCFLLYERGVRIRI